MAFLKFGENEMNLDIIDYEFKDNENDIYDLNWLQIELTLNVNQISFSIIDPCLLTFEIHELINWFEKLISQDFSQNMISFIEPNLIFEYVNGFIKVFFACEFKPKRIPIDQDFLIKIPFEKESVECFKSDLKLKAEKFPIRKPKNEN